MSERDEHFYMKWLKETGGTDNDLQLRLVTNGMHGVMCAFELWLKEKGYLTGSLCDCGTNHKYECLECGKRLLNEKT